ncbi:MAG: sodium:calcium antiporter [Candidatus Bathyarchaeia archaeon]
MVLLLSVAAFIASLLLLYVGSEKVVQAAGKLASSLNLHKVVVGTVFVATVTSAPEFLSSLAAAFYGSSQMALGNIIGSNIYNIPLIIGVCGLLGTFKIKNSTISKECLFMVGIAVLLMALTITFGVMSQWMGIIFLALYPTFIYYSIRKGNGYEKPVNPQPRKLAKTVAILVLGGAALVFGTFLLVYSAISMAELFGLSQFYAGLTIMALGCVVPETTVSVAAALHGEQEISIGNAIGDNIITMTLVLGLVALIRSFKVSIEEILTTVPFVILVTFILFVINKRNHKITKPWSILMLTVAAAAFILETLNHVI